MTTCPQGHPRERGKGCGVCARDRMRARRAVRLGACDCGEPADGRDGACGRCRFLDGRSTGEADVIAALRLLGKASPKDLEGLVAMSERNVFMVLKKLVAVGRVQKLGMEVFVFERANPWAGAGGKQQMRTYYELVSS